MPQCQIPRCSLPLGIKLESSSAQGKEYVNLFPLLASNWLDINIKKICLQVYGIEHKTIEKHYS